MNATLAQFQEAFVRALAGDGDLGGLAAQPGFRVYRNTVAKGCIDALAANFPTVEKLVGSDWFRAAAAVYVRDHPPRQPQLLNYGAGFAGFLRDFEPAATLPYLADVARIDRLWTESHVAADAPVATAGDLQRLAPSGWDGVVAVPHPAAHWAWFDTPAFSIWRLHREGAVDETLAHDIAWHGEGALLTRCAGEVRWQSAGHGLCAFLDASAGRADLLASAQLAAEIEPQADLATLFAGLLGSGAVTRFDPAVADFGPRAATIFLEQ